MLVMEEAVEIRVLSRQGKSIRAIARTLRVSRNTVRRYLRGQEVPRYRREARATKLDSYKQYVGERVKAAAPEWIPGSGAVSRAESTRLQRRLDHAQDVFGDAQASRGGRAADTLRDRARAAAASGFCHHPARRGSFVGVHRHARLEPCGLCGVRRGRAARDAAGLP